jgi:hypothetical protein
VYDLVGDGTDCFLLELALPVLEYYFSSRSMAFLEAVLRFCCEQISSTRLGDFLDEHETITTTTQAEI